MSEKERRGKSTEMIVVGSDVSFPFNLTHSSHQQYHKRQKPAFYLNCFVFLMFKVIAYQDKIIQSLHCNLSPGIAVISTGS